MLIVTEAINVARLTPSAHILKEMMRFTIALSLLLVQVASAANVENSQKVSNKLESFLEAAPKKVDLSKPMPLKAQEQGFSGKLVQHKNMKTHTVQFTRN